MVLRAGSVEVQVGQIERILAAQPEPLQEDLQKNAHLLLEEQATRDLLLQRAMEARPAKGPERAGPQPGQTIQEYLENTVLSQVTVEDADVKQFYETEKSLFGGATLDQMRVSIRKYLLDQKKQEAVRNYIRDLGKKTDIAVSESWLAKQAPLARDNPVDTVRDSGKPSFVEFGATGCGPCDMMVPILKNLNVKYKGKLNVLFVHVREKQVLAARYAIETIPIQACFDKEGREVFRHVGFFPQEEIEKKLIEMGVTP